MAPAHRGAHQSRHSGVLFGEEEKSSKRLTGSGCKRGESGDEERATVEGINEKTNLNEPSVAHEQSMLEQYSSRACSSMSSITE